MKFLTALLFLVVTVSQNWAHKLPASSWAREILKDDPAPDCGGRFFSCKDCTTARVCRLDAANAISWYKDEECPKDRAYCNPDSGTCQSQETSICGEPDDSFVCLQKDKYLPDENCTRFHYCDSTYIAKLFECKTATYVFDANKQMCVDPSTAACGSFSCQGQAVQKNRHSIYDTYYAMCSADENDQTPIVIDVCPEMFVLNVTSQQCEPDCKRYSEINIPDPTDCHFYYHCKTVYINAGDSIQQFDKLQCDESLAYDSAQFMCVDQATVNSCPQNK